ncbi:MAG: biopolymer transporter ExbD [Gammaproteobacteria bacterium]|nr:biopolymer transporter ExbD [Gammaproteobacteria bacterium]
MKKRRRPRNSEAELDITAFMNLMIVLVPVLLLGMVFSQITVINVQLPAGASGGDESADQQQIELLIRKNFMRVDYPRGVELKRIPLTPEGKHDFKMLSLVLQEVKRQLREQGIEKQAITLLSEQDIDYQTIISAMDTVRSFKAVVAASVVDAALFPEISFGDAPAAIATTAGGAG